MNGKKWICLAAALGAGYASGSEIALFYAQLGRAAHLAALIAMAAAWRSAGQIAVSILMISGAALTLRVCVRGTIRIVRERREL